MTSDVCSKKYDRIDQSSLCLLRFSSALLSFVSLFVLMTENVSANSELLTSLEPISCSVAFSDSARLNAQTFATVSASKTDDVQGLKPLLLEQRSPEQIRIADEAFYEELFYLNALYPKKKNIFSRVVDHQNNPDFKITDGATKFKNPKFQVLFEHKRQLTFFRPSKEVIDFLTRAFASGQILRVFKILEIQSIRISTLSAVGKPVQLDLLPVVSTSLRHEAASQKFSIQPNDINVVLVNGSSAQFISIQLDTFYYDLLALTKHHFEAAFDGLSSISGLTNLDLKKYLNPLDAVEILRGLGFEYETKRLGLAGSWRKKGLSSLEYYYQKILAAVTLLNSLHLDNENNIDPKFSSIAPIFYSVAMRLFLFKNLDFSKRAAVEAQLNDDANMIIVRNGKNVRKRLFDLSRFVEGLGYVYVTPNGYLTIDDAKTLKRSGGK